MNANPISSGAVIIERRCRLDNQVFSEVLGLAGLLVMITMLLAGSLPATPNTPRPGGLGTISISSYLRSGQLAADARTACSVVQFLLAPEPDV